MKTLTNEMMLAAAKTHLSRHLATRPLTETERSAAQQLHLDIAADLDREQAYQPLTAAEIGRGPHAQDVQHGEGILVAQSVRNVLFAKNRANHHRMIADSLSTPADQAWEQTRQELQGRVDYYSGLNNPFASPVQP